MSNLSSCDQTYGFLPCTTSVIGNIFLIFVYGYLLVLATKYLAQGIHSLMENLGPGFLAAFLPLFNSLPHAFIILAAGVFGSKDNGESRANIGMGYIAGSTVTLLTLMWGTCILLAKSDFGIHHSNSFSLTGCGVITNEETSYNARIMVISLIPFLIVQIPQPFNSTFLSRLAILISLIVSIFLLISYYLYQVWHPWTHKIRLDYAKHVQAESAYSVIHQMKTDATERFIKESGEIDIDEIQKLFDRIKNSDGYITAKELRAVICGLRFEDINQQDISFVITEFLKEFNAPFASRINSDEFVSGISNWIRNSNCAPAVHGETSVPSPPGFKFSHPAKRVLDTRRSLKMGALTVAATTRLMQPNKAEREKNDEAAFSTETSKWVTCNAIWLLIIGSIVGVAFANPLVDAVESFSKATSIPSIFTSFVILPFFTYFEIMQALFLASMKKKKINASLAFSEIYGRVTINNILCLSIFLAIILVRELSWNFTSQVLIILIICLGMGLLASFRTTFPLWSCLVAYILYPFSLILVYVFSYVLGLS